MKVFISWSGKRSEQVAEVLWEWLPTVLAGAVQPFISTHDVPKGERGLSVIASELEANNYGVVVLTKDNVDAPWVNFEAGALAKSIGEGRVATVLVDVTRTDIEGPLSQFQDTILSDKADTLKLVKDMAKASGEPIPESSINLLFESKWSELQDAVIAAGGVKGVSTRRTEKSILEEVLDIVRGLAREQKQDRLSAAELSALNLDPVTRAAVLRRVRIDPGEMLTYGASAEGRARLAAYDRYLSDAEADANAEAEADVSQGDAGDDPGTPDAHR